MPYISQFWWKTSLLIMGLVVGASIIAYWFYASSAQCSGIR